MTIERAPRRDRYTIIDNRVLEDDRLSFRSKGLLAYLLSKPDNWKTNREHLAMVGPDGVMGVRASMSELEAAGYVVRHRERDSVGRWTWRSVVHETPITGDAESERPPHRKAAEAS